MIGLASRRGFYRASSLARQVSYVRELATAAPHTSAASIPALLTAAKSSNPLKDAVKFYGLSNTVAAASDPISPPSEGAVLWSFRELDSHVRALATGMSDVGFRSGDKVIVCLPAGSQEYLSLLLAAADLGISVVALDPPANPRAFDVAPIREALQQHAASALFVWHGYKTADAEDSIFSTGESSILSALVPSASANDTRGRYGFFRVTGRSLNAGEFPSLKYIVHTGDSHIRGAITFKSLLVYSDAPRASSGSSRNVVLVEGGTGNEITHGDLLRDAKKVGSKLALSSDASSKNGKLVVRSEPTSSAATALVSAVMHETLLISAGLSEESEKSTDAAASENALLF